jgi:hypothetical protein
MNDNEKILGTAEAWESGALGRDQKHTKKASAGLQMQIDDALGMQMISIRLPLELIDEYKMIAKVNGLGYQPLMRDALKRFAEAEVKKMAVEYANVLAEAERVQNEARATEIASTDGMIAPEKHAA